jgi:hypothetical protein
VGAHALGPEALGALPGGREKAFALYPVVLSTSVLVFLAVMAETTDAG